MNKSKMKKENLMNKEMGKEGEVKSFVITSFCRHKREFLLPLDYLIPSTLLICPTLEEVFRFTFLGRLLLLFI